jgi:hypothetical protein
MKLKDYLEQYGIPVTALAKRTKMHAANAYRVVEGGNMRLDLAWNIVKFTKGAVDFVDLYEAWLLNKHNKKKSNRAKKKNTKKGESQDLEIVTKAAE